MKVRLNAGTRCLVLGGRGFLGRALCHALRRRGARVSTFGRSERGIVRAGTGETRAEFTDEHALEMALRGQDVVFHLLGTASPEAAHVDPRACLTSTVAPTIALLRLCRTAGVGKIILASSGGMVYGAAASHPTTEDAATHPVSDYGVAKLSLEQYLHVHWFEHGLDYRVLRIANPFGPGQSPFKRQGLVAHVVYRALTGRPVEIWGNGDTIRDFVYVDDVADAFARIAEYDGQERILNVGTGVGRSVSSVVQDVQRILAIRELTIRRHPARPFDLPISVLDPGRVMRATSWTPRVPWETGIARTARAIRRLASHARQA